VSTTAARAFSTLRGRPIRVYEERFGGGVGTGERFDQMALDIDMPERDANERDNVDTLSALVDRSLVAIAPTNNGSTLRYRLLD
jgi:hypothetical protein